MSLASSCSKALLAAAIIGSTVGSYIALSPPNPNTTSTPPTGDFIHTLRVTNKHMPKIVMIPLGLVSLHTASLAYLYPHIPSSIIRYGKQNGLNTNMITWSAATTVPLILMLGICIPLRLASYASLGKNFTFALAEPDGLKTTGIYHYMQHPSYTALITLVFCNFALLGRVDGAFSCWFQPSLHRRMRALILVLTPIILSLFVFAMWTRIKQEENMLQAKFGIEWDEWHATTSRLIPGIF